MEGVPAFFAFWLSVFQCDASRDLVPFVQFKTVKKTHAGVLATLLKVTLLHGCFSRFLNCTNGTKSHKTSHNVIHPV